MTDKPIQSADEIIARAIAIANEGRKKRVAVAAAQDADVIGAVAQAQADGFLDATLVGDGEKIKALANEHGIDIGRLELVNEPDVPTAAHKAVALASAGNADAIMKGFLPTSALLKAVLDKRYGLRGDNTLSHCAVLDIPGRHKLLNFTDGGMVVRPDPATKYQIIENAVLVAQALGLSPVKVAVSATVKKATKTIPHTMTDVDYVIPEARKRLNDVLIAGPMPVDIAMSPEAAKAYGVTDPVAGDADVFVVDSIEECNIICKSLFQFPKAIFSGVIVGARVPVSLVSRTDTVKNKKSSLALACLLADYYALNDVFGKGEN
ncbi:MAG TPA: phosphate acyltransferase [candidate division Zixibacteria bacterium]|nr:phosphate acyltransferase [candidate division Zixibacteria bacterium]